MHEARQRTRPERASGAKRCGSFGACAFAARLAICCIVAAVAALVPVSIDMPDMIMGKHVQVDAHESHAYADTAPDAEGFLSSISSDAGLSPADFVVTIVAANAIRTGKVIVGVDQVVFGGELTENLSALIDTADYPDWEYLTDEEKTFWRSSTNYDAAKFNALLTAFGLDSAREQFYSSARYDLTEETQQIVQHLGAIGNTWIDRASVPFSDVKQAVKNPEYVSGWVGVNDVIVDGSQVQDWPEILPENLTIGVGDNFRYAKENWRIVKLTNKPVYWINYVYRASSGYFYITTRAFSESPFAFNMRTGNNIEDPQEYSFSASEYNYGTKKYYSWNNSLGGTNYSGSNVQLDAPAFCNMPVTVLDGVTYDEYNTAVNTAIPLILFGAQKTGFSVPEVPDYPSEEEMEELPDDTPTYAPSPINSTNNWITYLTEPEKPTPRPDNPYNPPDEDNPQYQSGTPEWKQDTTENVLPLANIRFGELFPFSMLADIPLLFNKVKSVTGQQQTSGMYNRIDIPIVIGHGVSDVLTLDLQWVHDLLLMVRPWLQILIGALLLIVTVEFWRGILTG